MKIDCGTQCWMCDLPIRMDTYRGCSHLCKYCYMTRAGKCDLSKIVATPCHVQLENFIQGQRSEHTAWCDWDIPLHWGGTSDPFQPIEESAKASLACLQVFARTKYPVIISTKGRLVASQPYLDLLGQCRAVVQISMACSEYDRLEPGAPSFEERLQMLQTLSPVVTRTIVRIQPYFREYRSQIIANLPRFAEAGAHGIILEGYKALTKTKGMEKLGGDYVYPLDKLRRDFEVIREKAHECGLRFYAGENRLRAMGDSMTCCGVDGLEDFKPNEYNLAHLLHGEEVKPTEAQKKPGTGGCFLALYQKTLWLNFTKEQSFAVNLKEYYETKRATVHKVLGIAEKGGL